MQAPTDRQASGKLGEELAAQTLSGMGYAILATRHRTRYGEIDIIATDRNVLVFVEVKARRHDRFGSAAESVTTWKQRRIIAMARDYLNRVGGPDVPCRFDVVAIDGLGTAQARVQVIKDAFAAE